MKRLFNRDDDRLQYEFLPAAEEIVSTPAMPFGRIIIWLTMALLVVAFAWSYFGKLDIIAVAPGKVAPEGSVKTVQAASSGVVTEIKVREGQIVKKGQLLVQLDTELAEKDVEVARQSLKVAELERDIFAGEISGDALIGAVAEADLPFEVQQHLVALSGSKSQSIAAERQLLLASVSSAEQQVTSQKQRKSVTENSLAELRASEQEMLTSLQDGASSASPSMYSELRTVRQQISTLESAVATHDQQIAEAEAGVVQANQRLSVSTAETNSTDHNSVIGMDKQIAGLISTLAGAKQRLQQLSLRSPVDGEVLTLATKTIGGVVSAAQPIVEIVPTDATLTVEANVANQDIGFIRVGQPVVVKVDAYSFQRYGYLRGTVESISPDTITDEQRGPVYKMIVAITSNQSSKGNQIATGPGMSVTAEITTGKRRIIEFFLDPLMTHTDTSLEVR